MPLSGTISHMPTMLAALFVLTLSLTTASSTIQWRNCSSEQAPLRGPRLQCAELSVPLNWSDPQCQNITVGLTRLQAKDAENRIGSLVFSPGGPADPASPLLGAQSLGVDLFPQNITNVFDLIGFDPRGVGPISTPIVCNPKIFNKRMPAYPISERDFSDLVSANQAAWSNCANLTGPLLFNIDSGSIARDLEALRIALDGGPLNFLSLSYMTIAAQQFAQIYPENFRTIAMDAVIDHNSSATAQFFDEAQAFESSLHRFASWCNSTNTTVCALAGQDVLAIYDKVVTDALDSPLPAPGCEGTVIGTADGCFSNITAAEIMSFTQSLLLFKRPTPFLTAGWPGLADALALAAQGNGTAMAQAYAAANLATSKTSNTFAAATMPCLDFNIDLASYSDVKNRLSLGSQVAPITRGLSFKWSQQLRCIGFPRPATNPQGNMNVNNIEPILITQSKWDPNAAYLWAEEARNEIRSNALVLREGDGHTNSFLNGDTARITWQYFITGRAPSKDLVVSS